MGEIVLNKQTTVALAESVVAKFGADHVYATKGEKCVYVKGGLPSCLVGQVLHAAGVPLELLEQADNIGGGQAAAGLLDELKALGVVQVGPKVSTYLSILQSQQDLGDTWGYALEVAGKYI